MLTRAAARLGRRASLRWALATGRPLPEEARDRFFLGLHRRAELAYDEGHYPGDALIVYGEGLYEDPALGWGGLVGGAIESHAIAGEHLDNRDLLDDASTQQICALLTRRLEDPHAAAAAAHGAEG
jgi:hypothetical protein